MTLLTTIQKYGPLSTTEIWLDILDMRRASPCKDLPATFDELASVLLGMNLDGEIKALPGDRWEAVRKVVREERTLFS